MEDRRIILFTLLFIIDYKFIQYTIGDPKSHNEHAEYRQ